LGAAIAALCVLFISSLSGCALQSQYFDNDAHQLGFTRQVVMGEGFQHAIYRHDGVRRSTLLHVYLGGDGSPWLDHRLISADPTPQNALVLKLMAVDPVASLYLGRPCYHGFSTTEPCNPRLWTSARYSSTVVTSMQRVLQDFMHREGFREVVLIGYSGGGTLAMLLAERIAATTTVVTIAGNLDIDAWTRYHAYTPLVESMNPALRPVLDARVEQYHLIGQADSNVPWSLVDSAIQRQPDAHVLLWQDFDHACCWQSIWQQFLPCLEGQCNAELLGASIR
jgi:pimeloyl-ACP methyl ester carboxylesterase